MIILTAHPMNLFDAGFQLSFACVFSIIYLNMRLGGLGAVRPGQPGSQARGWHHRIFFQPLLLSLSIFIGVAGLIAYYFGIVTPVTIFANLFVVPLIAAVVTLGLGLLIIGSILPSWAFMFAVCLKVVLNVMVGLIYLFLVAPRLPELDLQ